MAPLSLYTAALAASTVSALQIPFFPSQLGDQLGLGQQKDTAGYGLAQPVVDASKPTIDTEALQKLIHADNLYKRAETLYEIAKLGEQQYGHPTRVIGSKGMLPRLPSCLCLDY